FFFQAEDGIRDFHVTGVQTCALPISAAAERFAAGDRRVRGRRDRAGGRGDARRGATGGAMAGGRGISRRGSPPGVARRGARALRSEERRVGKEWRARGRAYQWKRKAM